MDTWLVLMPTPLPPSAAAPHAGQVSCPFRFLEDSKHAYYLVFDFEIDATDTFGSTTARAGLPAEPAVDNERALLKLISLISKNAADAPNHLHCDPYRA